MSCFDVSVSKDLESLKKRSKCNSKRVRKTSQQTESRSKRPNTVFKNLSYYLPARSAFRFWGFYPPQIPPGWLPSQPPALSLLSNFGVLPAPNPPRLVAFPTPRAFFAFGFWGFTRPNSTQVGCLPNPPPALSLLSVFGVIPASNPPRLVAFPTPCAFFAFGFWGFTRPKSLQFGCLPNPPRFLCFRFSGFYPPQFPPGWLPSQPPRAFFAFGFWCFTRPRSPRLVAFPTPRSFFAFQFWGFIRPKLPGVFSSRQLTLSAFCLLPSLITISTFLHFTNRCGPIGKSCYR